MLWCLRANLHIYAVTYVLMYNILPGRYITKYNYISHTYKGDYVIVIVAAILITRLRDDLCINPFLLLTIAPYEQ